MKLSKMTIVAGLVLSASSSGFAADLHCDMSNQQAMLRSIFIIRFDHDQAKLVNYSGLCNENPCIAENSKFPLTGPATLQFTATLLHGTFVDTGTNRSDVMVVTLKPITSEVYRINAIEIGIPGNSRARLKYRGKCSLGRPIE